MKPLWSVYYCDEMLVEWLAEFGESFEEGLFRAYKEKESLHRLVEKVEDGQIPKYIALDAIEQFNSLHGESLTYKELSDNTWRDFVFAPEGESVVFSDDVYAILRSPCETLIEAIDEADVEWVLILEPNSGELTVAKSPYTARRKPMRSHLRNIDADGGLHGPALAYVLPPDIEAALLTDEGA